MHLRTAWSQLLLAVTACMLSECHCSPCSGLITADSSRFLRKFCSRPPTLISALRSSGRNTLHECSQTTKASNVCSRASRLRMTLRMTVCACQGLNRRVSTTHSKQICTPNVHLQWRPFHRPFSTDHDTHFHPPAVIKSVTKAALAPALGHLNHTPFLKPGRHKQFQALKTACRGPNLNTAAVRENCANQ